MPSRAIICWLPSMPMLLSVTLMDPFCVPASMGVNVTLSTQLSPTASVPLQVFVCEKSPPASAMLVKASGAPPTLVRATASGALGVPTACEAKVSPGEPDSPRVHYAAKPWWIRSGLV